MRCEGPECNHRIASRLGDDSAGNWFVDGLVVVEGRTTELLPSYKLKKLSPHAEELTT